MGGHDKNGDKFKININFFLIKFIKAGNQIEATLNISRVLSTRFVFDFYC